MKKLFSLAAAICLVFSLSTCAKFREPEPDYLKEMLEAAQNGDVEAGRQAETLYNQQMQNAGREAGALSFDQLYLLSQAIHYKYGHYRYSDELRMCAGEVILNRMASPEYPDSMEAVIFQPQDQKPPDVSQLSRCSCPMGNCVKAACRLMLGERMLEPEVVLETHTPARNVYAIFCNDLLGNTYFYKSEHPELYSQKTEENA